MKGLFLFTAIVVCLLLAIVGCSDRTTVPDTTSGATTEPSSTAIIEGTPTAIPNGTQEGTPDITHETTPEPTTVTTVAPTAAPTKTPTATKTPESTPRPKNPAKLSAEQEKEIKEAYLALITKYDEIQLSDIIIDMYLGTYNGGVALMLHSSKSLPNSDYFEVTVAGYSFGFASSTNKLFIYRNGTFTEFTSEYNSGLLTTEDIRDIHWYYNHQ